MKKHDVVTALDDHRPRPAQSVPASPADVLPQSAEGERSAERALLAEAFRLFNENTERLRIAHEALENRVAEIDAELEERNRQLARSNNELETKIQELDEVRNFMGSVINSMNSGLVTVDTSGDVITFNGAAEQITGFQADRIIGRPILEVFPQSGALLLDTLEVGRAFENMELGLPGADGRVRPVRGSSAVIRDSEGRCLGATMTFLDLSHLKLMEEKVRRNARLAALGELAAGVAHEMRNPLTTVRGFVQILPHQLDDPTFLQDMGANVIREIDRLASLTDSLLDLAKPVGMELSKARVDILFEEVLMFAAEKIDRAAVAVERDLPEIECPMDRNRMKQVLLNLVLNACDAMKPGQRLRVSVESRADVPNPRGERRPHIVMIVEDEGHGMDEATRERLFDPFFTTKDHGTGLGLSISHRIVEEHHGFIRVHSEPGQGSIFEVYLPENPTESGWEAA